MRTFRLSPAMQPYFNALVQAGTGDVRAIGIPPVPAPVGAEETAFYNAVIVPLAAAVAAAVTASMSTIPLPGGGGAVSVQPSVDPRTPEEIYAELYWQQQSAGAP